MTATTSKLGADMLTDEEIFAIADDNDSGRAMSGRRLFSERNLLLFARALLARQPAAIDKQDEIARIRYGALRDAENIARLFDLGTPDGHAIADSIRKLAEAECAQPTAAPSVAAESKGHEAFEKATAVTDPVMADFLSSVAASRANPAPSVEQDEREAFEAWARTNDGNCNDKDLQRSIHDGGYINKLVERDWLVWQARAASTSANVAQREELTVWYGSLPESNGKTNWTAILHKGDIAEGHTIDRSEYPDRVRYEADCVRYLIGELKERPWILDYDADKHSGYVANVAQGAEAVATVEDLNLEVSDGTQYKYKGAILNAKGDALPHGTSLYAAPPAQHKSDWHPDFVTALYDNADPDKRYTMDQMREYADAFHRSRIDAAPPAQTALTDDARECLADVVSHYRALYAGLAFQLNEATVSENSDDMTYWKHEIKALERMYAQAERALTAAQSASASEGK
jgi:hypothetical protein